MPKDKERSVNPAAAQRKLEKQKNLKKGKAEALARRNEKLARRNPERIQRQINDLKEMEQSGQGLRPREKEILEALERDLRAVQKAREALGDRAPKFESSQNRQGTTHIHRPGRGDGRVLGKRRREGHRDIGEPDIDSSETDEEVKRIPMPRDTPPPIPRKYTGRNQTDEKEQNRADSQGPHPLPTRPGTEVKTVYEAKPEIRDLRQEAINKFVPAAVRAKQDAIRGQGKLLEPEELESLEQAGYNAGPTEARESWTANRSGAAADDNPEMLLEEERRFSQELKTVQIEEVEDEDA